MRSGPAKVELMKRKKSELLRSKSKCLKKQGPTGDKALRIEMKVKGEKD